MSDYGLLVKIEEPKLGAYAQRLVLQVLRNAAEKGERLTSRQVAERTGCTPIMIVGRNGTRKVVSFGISDPRRTIAHLRERGFAIESEWHTNTLGKGYKEYWLADPQQASKPQQGKEGGNE